MHYLFVFLYMLNNYLSIYLSIYLLILPLEEVAKTRHLEFMETLLSSPTLHRVITLERRQQRLLPLLVSPCPLCLLCMGHREHGGGILAPPITIDSASRNRHFFDLLGFVYYFTGRRFVLILTVVVIISFSLTT